MADRRLATLAAALAGLIAAAPQASAREWPGAGGWDIVEGEDYCAIGSEFEGPGDSELYLLLYLDGSVVISLSNENWTIKEKDEVDLSFLVNGKTYAGGKAVGAPLSGKPGLVSSFKSSFVDDFTKSKSLDVYKGKVVVDQLDLAGSSAGVAQARRCLAHLRASKQAEAREKARWSGIAQDPFARAGDSPARPGSLASPLSELSTLVAADDYPASAVDAGEQGNVAFRLSVDAGGMVTGCEVTRSSGSSALDQATCNIMRRRARFAPARLPNGDRTAGTFEGSLNWSLQ